MMYFDDISSSSELQNQAIKTELTQTNPTMNELDSSVSMFFLWTTVFSIIILVLLKILQKLEKSNPKGLLILLNSQAPCRNCRFFDKNEYLKCAVNPCTVLTKQATNCSDYCNKDLSFSHLFRNNQNSCQREIG